MRSARTRAGGRPGWATSPARLLRLAVASLVTLFVVVTSGAFVRLTGSGLGCENWPRCGDKPYPEQGFHAFVEFGNRLVALVGILLTLVVWLAARRQRAEGEGRLSRGGRLAALGAFLGAIAQIPLGGLTVTLDLHPLAVMSHFLLGLVVLGLALVVVLEAWGATAGRRPPVEPRPLRVVVLVLGVPACAALVVSGAVATASGPHSGSEDALVRLGPTISETVYWHVRVAAAFGLGVLAVGWALLRRRERAPGLAVLWAALVAVLGIQAVLGEVQYRNGLPWGLVLVHVFLAALVWTLALALAHGLFRPAAPLVERAAAAPHEAGGARALTVRD